MYKELFSLAGKTALVSGASRGIGEAIAMALSEVGAYVIVSSRRLADCEDVAKKIIAAGGKAEAVACNVGKLEDIEKVYAYLKDQHDGKLDILINNAAANPYFGHVLDTDLAAYEKTVDVNIRGFFFMSVEAGRLMKARGGGVIINTASVNALQPGAGQGIYSITKAAVVNMTKTFAKECGNLGIRCNAILPGLTNTKFAGALFTHDDIYNAAIANIPMGRHAEPNEMAGTVLYLASDASSYTNGECIVVDGGLTI
jgi:NAD(P)-dependent dehydrogenase (short-subunit alcohol dehydrogenase family)